MTFHEVHSILSTLMSSLNLIDWWFDFLLFKTVRPGEKMEVRFPQSQHGKNLTARMSSALASNLANLNRKKENLMQIVYQWWEGEHPCSFQTHEGKRKPKWVKHQNSRMKQFMTLDNFMHVITVTSNSFICASKQSQQTLRGKKLKVRKVSNFARNPKETTEFEKGGFLENGLDDTGAWLTGWQFAMDGLDAEHVTLSFLLGFLVVSVPSVGVVRIPPPVSESESSPCLMYGCAF